MVERATATGRGIVVHGAQWGDEGKGKIVDLLTENAQAVVRFQGGNNAGTPWWSGRENHRAPDPLGHPAPDTTCLVGNGVVWTRGPVPEMDTLAGRGVDVSPKRLIISKKTQVIMPYHGSWTGPGRRSGPGPRSAPPAGASGRATRTRWPASASGPGISPIPPAAEKDRGRPGGKKRPVHRPLRPCGPGPAGRVRGGLARGRTPRPAPGRRVHGDPEGPRGRGRRALRGAQGTHWTSTTAPIPS